MSQAEELHCQEKASSRPLFQRGHMSPTLTPWSAVRLLARDARVYRVGADASLRQDRQSMPWLLGRHLAGLDANTGLVL